MPRPAATVALIRDGANGIEAWMMRRAAAMTFASGASVFPGGRVDPSDADPALPWMGPSAEEFAIRLGVDVDSARALVNAALRELFEECGVLLSTPALSHLDLTLARARSEQHLGSLVEVFTSHACAWDVSLLHPWGRWVTPASESRRYDTWFFVAEAPHGTRELVAGSEADRSGWVLVQDVLDATERGQLHVLPPTTVMLRGLRAGGTVAGVIEAAQSRTLTAVHPEVRHNPDGTITVLGGGEEVVIKVRSA